MAWPGRPVSDGPAGTLAPGMAVDLTALIRPGHVALVTSELQRSVVGPHSPLPALAAAAAGAVTATAALCRTARVVSVPVIHCTAARRADALGSNANARLFVALNRSGADMTPGSAGVAVVDELGPEPSDLVLSRLHGLSPMAGTDLDPILRNLGVDTLVVAGVSVNVAVTNLVMDAVNRGYQVVVPRDAVAGTPAAYADAVLDGTIGLLASLTTTAAVIAAWEGSAP